MTQKRWMVFGVFMVSLVMVILMLVVLSGCSKSAVSQPTASAAAPAAAAPTSVSAAPSAAAAANILKIGYVGDMSWPLTVEAMKSIQIYQDMYTQSGGLDIGGVKYEVQFILYDSKGDQSTGTAAINRLIFEDGVKFILSDFTPLADAYLPITEANKVIFSDITVTPPIFDPKYHYCFETGALPAIASCAPYWFVKNNPNVKNAVLASPDTQMGHMGGADASSILKYNGLTVTEIYYPANTQDLSSLGTKVTQLNPDVCLCQGGGALVDSLAQKAIYNAGYRGQFFAATPSTALSLAQVTPADVLEGEIISAYPCEFDPPLTQDAKDFKDAFIAKYGQYQGESLGMCTWDAVRTALQTAGSTDTDKVAGVLSNGLKYAGSAGTYQMIPRVDFGNSLTVDSAQVVYMKKIVKGQPVLLGTLSLEEAVTYMNTFHAAARK